MARAILFAFIIAVGYCGMASSQDEPPQPLRTVPQGRGAPPGGRGGFIPAGGFTPASSSASSSATPSESSSRGGLTSRPIPTSRPLPTTIGKSLTFDVLIAGRFQADDSPPAGKILELVKAGKLDYANRLQITTLEDLPAVVQFGARTARVIGRTNTGLSVTPIYNDVNLGSILQVTGRVTDDGTIVAQIYVEQSFLAGGEEAAFDPQANLPPKAIEQQTAQATARLKPDEPQIIGGHQAAAGHESSQTWIVVTGHVSK